MARKTRLNKKMIDKICGFLEKGAYIDSACKASATTRKTYYEWLKKAKSSSATPLQKEFKRRTEEALAKYEMELQNTIELHSVKTWQAAAWLLERRFKSKWAKEADLSNTEVEKEEVDDKFL